MVDIVRHIFFHLIGHRAVLCQFLKDGLLEFFHGHLFVRFVRVPEPVLLLPGQLQVFLLPAAFSGQAPLPELSWQVLQPELSSPPGSQVFSPPSLSP